MSASFAGAAADQRIEQRLVLDRVSWDSYVSIGDALGERPGIRMIYCDGTLILAGKSRGHFWYAKRLGECTMALAQGMGIAWEDAGGATFRQRDSNAGLEGDETFYLGDHAVQMRGPQDIDLNAQPPPDIAVEVEVSHSADVALVAWGLLGVPEVWRFRPRTWEFHFCIRNAEGSYSDSEHSIAFPWLNSSDVLSQMDLANELGADQWNKQLGDWVKNVIHPRQEGGAR
jgi:Uma2 family endonuclease